MSRISVAILCSIVAAFIGYLAEPFLPINHPFGSDLKVHVEREMNDQSFGYSRVGKIELSISNEGRRPTEEIELLFNHSLDPADVVIDYAILVDDDVALVYPDTPVYYKERGGDDWPGYLIAPLLPKQSIGFSIASKIGIDLVRVHEGGRPVRTVDSHGSQRNDVLLKLSPISASVLSLVLVWLLMELAIVFSFRGLKNSSLKDVVK
ncbi:hypothetical protein [uncultured Aliiroseovarius sp.]|nr:hypothetical protein [uncultured Aliiroseovarius sp.]